MNVRDWPFVGATISDDGLYRYKLWRAWDPQVKSAIFIGLNPSTADAETDDATIRRMCGYAKRWGFGGIMVVNLFAYRATVLDKNSKVEDIVGPENDEYIRRCAVDGSFVVACWGAHPLASPRGQEVYELIRERAHRVCCLGLTKGGQPKHPVRLPYDLELQDFTC